MTSSTRRFPRTALAWGLSLFLVLSGASASQAYWTSDQTSTPSGTGGTVDATQSGLTSLAGQFTKTSLVRTTTVTLTNTGNISEDWAYTLTSGSAAVAATTFTTWVRATGQTCTNTAIPSGGSTATGAMPGALTGTFAPGATAVLCVRVTLSAAGEATYGAQNLALSGTLASSVYNWTGGGTTATTMTIKDDNAPSAPVITVTRLTGFSARVTWPAATDNVAVTGYKIYRGATLLATVGASTLSYLDTTMAANTGYTYYVQAFDAAGNTANSNSVSFTTLNITSNTTYSLHAANTGYCVDVGGADPNIGAGLLMWDCHGGPNQQFAFRPQSDGTYILEPQHSTNTGVGAPNSNAGSTVSLQSKSDPTTHWVPEALPGGGFAFRNDATGLYFDVWSGSILRGANVTQWYQTGNANQNFRLQ